MPCHLHVRCMLIHCALQEGQKPTTKAERRALQERQRADKKAAKVRILGMLRCSILPAQTPPWVMLLDCLTHQDAYGRTQASEWHNLVQICQRGLLGLPPRVAHIDSPGSMSGLLGL